MIVLVNGVLSQIGPSCGDRESARRYNRPVTLADWLDAALKDADRRNLPALRALLEGLARSTAALRAAEWNDDAGDQAPDAR